MNNKTITALEALLYQKAGALVEAVMLQESAQLLGELEVLNEADPKPRVERDHRGLPVVPTQQLYASYFEAMAASHIKDQLRAAHTRWTAAEDHARKANQEAEADKKDGAKDIKAQFAAADLRALRSEISAAERALQHKGKAATAFQKTQKKKTDARNKRIHGMVKDTVHGLTGGSRLAALVAQHLALHLFKPHESK